MAFIASTQVPDDVYSNIKGQVLNLKTFADSKVSEFATGGLSNEVLRVLDVLVTTRNRMDAVSAIPGITEYAQTAEDDPAYDVIAEFQTVRAAVVAAITEIQNTFPVSANGYAEEFEFGQDGARVYRLFTEAQLSGLRTALQNISATIA